MAGPLPGSIVTRRWAPLTLVGLFAAVVVAAAALALTRSPGRPSVPSARHGPAPSARPGGTGHQTSRRGASGATTQGGPPGVVDCAGSVLVRPAELVLACADGSIRAEDVTWSSWTDASASGRGVVAQNDCVPFCAAGIFHRFPATFSLGGVVQGAKGPVFTVLLVTFTGLAGGPGGERTASFGLSAGTSALGPPSRVPILAGWWGPDREPTGRRHLPFRFPS